MSSRKPTDHNRFVAEESDFENFNPSPGKPPPVAHDGDNRDRKKDEVKDEAKDKDDKKKHAGSVWLIEKWNEEQHPRVPAGGAGGGQFTSGEGGGGESSSSTSSGGGSGSGGGGKHESESVSGRHNDEKYHDPETGKYHVKADVEAAVRLIGQGKDVVLEQPRELSTLLDRLAVIGKAEAAKPESERKVYDLCRVSVAGTNLFCAESAGYDRVSMPQLGGKPKPGTPGDSLPKNKKGEIDSTAEFVHHLEKEGYKVKETKENASHLRATQRELDGGKVAGMLKKLQEGGKFKDDALVISKDNYIIDGHHRWAAQVAYSYTESVKIKMPVLRVNISVVPLVEEANKWTDYIGIPRRAVGKHLKLPKSGCALPVVRYGPEA